MTVEVTERFRFNAQRVMLTYKSHLDKQKLFNFVNGLYSVARSRICHETSDAEMEYDHTHACFEFEDKIDVRNSRKFDFETIHPHFKTLKSEKAFLDCVLIYLTPLNSKGKPTDSAPLDVGVFDQKKNMIDGILECDTRADALKRFAYGENSQIQYTSQVLQIFNLKTPKVVKELVLRPWQKEAYDILMGPVDDRAIHWFYDKKGEGGKSVFCKYMLSHHDRDTLIATQFGGAKDSATIIMNAVQNGWTGKVFIADLPRACEVKSIYEPLESIKNGMFTAIKYQGGTSIWDSGHVMVFANFLPKVRLMSLDRWRIFSIIDNACTGLTLNDVQCILDGEDLTELL